MKIGADKSQFQLEPLEPRVLLSGDGLLSAAAPTPTQTVGPMPAEEHHVSGSTDTLSANLSYASNSQTEDIFGGVTKTSTSQPAPDSAPQNQHDPAATPAKTVATESQVARANSPFLNTPSINRDPSVLLGSSSDSSLSKVEELTETLKAANGPPQAQLASQLSGSLIPEFSFNAGLISVANKDPADPFAAVSPNYLVAVTNLDIAWFDKQGNELGEKTIPEFFGTLSGWNLTDPRVLYDPYEGRFVASILRYQDDESGVTADAKIVLAVSKTENPGGDWFQREFNGLANAQGGFRWPDQPTIAIDDKAVYVAGDMFPSSGSAAPSGGVPYLWIVDKGVQSSGFYADGTLVEHHFDPLTESGLALNPNMRTRWRAATVYGDAETGLTHATSGLIGSTQDVGTFLAGLEVKNVAGSDQITFRVIQIQDPLSATPTFVASAFDAGLAGSDAQTTSYSQQGSAVNVRIDDGFGITSTVWRNDALWAVATEVSTSDPAPAVLWLRLDTSTPSGAVTNYGWISASSLGAQTGTSRASIAVDNLGNAGISFAAFGPNLFPGAYFAGVERQNNGTYVATPIEAVATGVTFYDKLLGGGGSARWGDYSAAVFDDSNGRFWSFNMFPQTNNEWRTRWASYRMGAAIGNYVFLDANQDGVRQNWEFGVGGVKVWLWKDDGDNIREPDGDDSLVDTTYTDALGYYVFSNLDSGNTYFVEFRKEDGYDFTTANVGGIGADNNSDVEADITVGIDVHHVTRMITPGGSVDLTVDAGLLTESMGRVFRDKNNDSIWNVGEPIVKGMDVNLYRDTNGNGLREPDAGDTLVAETTTDADGRYAFFGEGQKPESLPNITSPLPAGSYFVEFKAPLLNSYVTPNLGTETTDSDVIDTDGRKGYTIIFALGTLGGNPALRTELDAGVRSGLNSLWQSVKNFFDPLFGGGNSALGNTGNGVNQLPDTNKDLGSLNGSNPLELGNTLKNSPGPNLGDLLSPDIPFKQYIDSILGAGDEPNEQNVADAIKNYLVGLLGNLATGNLVNGGSVKVTSDFDDPSQELRFAVQIDATKLLHYNLNLSGLSGLTTSGPVPVEVAATFQLDYVLGFTLADFIANPITHPINASNVFLRLNNFNVSAALNTDLPDITATVGAQSIALEGGTVALQIGANFTITENAPVSGDLTVADILANKFTAHVTPTGSFHASLLFNANLNSEPLSGAPLKLNGSFNIGLDDNDLFDNNPAKISMAFDGTLVLADFMYVTGQMSFQKGLNATATLSDASIKSVSVTTVGADSVSLFVGVNGPANAASALGVSLSGVRFGLALLKPVNNLDTSSYYALEAHTNSASLVGVNGVTLNVTTIDILANSSNNDGIRVANFTIGDLDGDGDSDGHTTVKTGPSSSLDLDLSQKILEASGTMQLVLGNFVYVSGNFAFRKGATASASLSDASTKSVSVLAVGGDSVNVFAGINGPANAMGAMGVSLTGVRFGLAFLKPVDTSDTSNYYGLKAHATSASLVGVNSVTLNVTSLDVLINSSNNDNDRVVVFTAGDLDGDGDTDGHTTVKTGPSTSIDLDMSQSVIEASGNLQLVIGNFVYVDGNFAFRKGPTATATLSDASTKSVSVLMVGGDSVNVFAGINGPANAVGALGVSLTGVQFGLALLKPVNTSDGSSYYGFKVHATAGNLVGVNNITLSVTTLDVLVSDSNDAQVSNRVVDFTAGDLDSDSDTDGHTTVQTGPSTSLDLDMSQRALKVSGAVTLRLSGFVDLGGNFVFERAQIDTNGDFITESVFTAGVQELHFDLKAGSTSVVSFNQGSGAFVMSSAGLAGVATLQFQVGIIGLSGTINLEVNSTNSPIVNVMVSTPGGPVNINLPNTNYVRVCITNGYIHLGSVAVPLPSFQVVISGGNVVFEPKGGGAPYLTIHSDGSIALGSLPFSNFDFAKADPFQFISMLKQLVDWIESLRGSSFFSTAIPFTGGKTIGDAFDWSQRFIDNVYSHLVSVDLQSAVVRSDADTSVDIPAGTATFQIKFDDGTPTNVTVNGIPHYLANTTLNDLQVDGLVSLFNAGLLTAGLYVAPNSASNRVEARRNRNGQLVIALSDSEVAKGTKLTVVSTNDEMVALGFGPKDADQVATLTDRYSTDGPASLFSVLADWLDDGSLNNSTSVNYQAAQQVYTFDVNSSHFLGPANFGFDVPFHFDQDFGPIANAQLEGKINISANVNFHFTLGFDLSAGDVPRLLSSSALPVPVNGRLSDDAHFDLYINDKSDLANQINNLVLTKAATAGNNSIEDLAQDLNDLFANPLTPKWHGTSLSDLLIAQKAGTGLAISAKSSQLGIINRLEARASQQDTFATEMGYALAVDPADGRFVSASNSSIKGLFIDGFDVSGVHHGPELSASLSITTPVPIKGSLSFGFVNISTDNGVFGTYTYDSSGNPVANAVKASVSLANQSTSSTRFYISDLMNGTSSNNIGNMVNLALTGTLPNAPPSFLLRLNDISVDGLGFSLPLTNPQISVFIPDIKSLDFNPNPYDPVSNNKGIFLTYPSLGDLQDFTSFSFSQILQALQALAENLSKLSAFSFLDKPLPLIDLSVNDLISYAAKFANLIDNVGKGGAQSFQDVVTALKTQIDQLFHLDPSILTISLDNNGILPGQLKTSVGVNNITASSTTITPNGLNNDFILTSNLSNAANLSNSFIRIVGDSSINGNNAAATWNATNKILTIKINAGVTTAKAVIDAINAAHTLDPNKMPWMASKPGSDANSDNIFTTSALEFRFNFSTLVSKSLSFQLDLQQLAAQLDGTSPAVAALLQAVTSLVQVGASGNLTVSASAELKLDFGLDLTNPARIKPFVYDDTGITLTAKVLGTNIDIQATLGAIAGIYIKNGTLTVDRDGNPATTATSTPPDKGAEFHLLLRDNNGDGRHYFDENWFDSDNIDLNLIGGVSATLPIFAPLEGLALGGTADTDHDGYPDNDLVIDIPDLVRLFISETVSTGANGSDATVLFGGLNNDILIKSNTHTNYKIKFLSTLSGDVANATFDNGANTLFVNVDRANTTAQTAMVAIKGQPGFTNTSLTQDDDGDPATMTNSGAGKLAKLFITTPDFSKLFDNLDLCDVISSSTGPLLNGLDKLLGSLQDSLNAIVLHTKLPIIGDGLAGAANFIQDFRNGLLKELRDAVNAAGGNGLTALENAIKKAFWNTLGPGGLNLLVDSTTHEALDPAEGPSQLDVTLDCNDGLVVNLELKKEIALLDTSAHPINFDIGVPGFSLKASGNVKVALGFDLKFGFGVNKEDGFFFNSSAPASDPELQIYFRVTLPSLHFTGQLLFLQLDIADNVDDPSIFQGQFSVDLADPNDDGKLTWAELSSGGTQFSDIVKYQLGADAKVNLDLAASFGGNTAFPRVLAQFHLRWHFDLANGAEPVQIYFDNVGLDLGTFISDFLGPILEKIQSVTKPIQPIVDIVTARIPVLSDLAGEDITLLDLARIFGLLEPSTVDFIKDVLQVVTLINDIQGIGQGSIIIPFGSFSLTSDNNGEMKNIGLHDADVRKKLDQEIARVNTGPGVSSTYKSASAGFASDLGSIHNFSIPVFDHPSELFNLFIGKPVRLVEWRMPTFKFKFTYVQKIPIYPPLYAQFGGTIGADINIGFGYDTFGIQKFISDPKKNPVDLLDGFYIITNDTSGQPQPALTLTGEVFAGASLDLGIIEAGVRGGISLTVKFFWNDNADNDGKMRVSEIIANVQQDPRCIFNIQGEVSLFLEAFLKIDLLFFSIDKTWRFATITLISFDLTCPEPVLGEMSGSTLTLNIGSRASLREVGDTSDGSETFVVRHTGGNAGSESVDVTFGTHRQSFMGVAKVVVQDAGSGDDVLDFRGIKAPVDAHAGPGNDTIYLSDGTASIAYGSDGDDTITASSASTATGVVIYGDAGNDTLTASKLAIEIHGGEGTDTITGSPEADKLYGDGGNDIINAGEKNDYIEGGAGSDTINASGGSDFVLAGSGDDFINAGPDSDVVDAGDGHDVVFGGSGDDLLIGGNDDDNLYGDGGNDLLIGDQVGSVTYNGGDRAITFANLSDLTAAVTDIPAKGIAVKGLTGSGDDFIVGGGDNDALFGGDGNDVLYGGNFAANGDTAPIREDGNDFIDGGRGNDLIFGDDSLGRTGDRNTGIAIKSSIWYDNNTNGKRDEDETGFGGVTVWLYAASNPPTMGGSPVATTKTDVDGAFRFVGLDPNKYVIVFDVPSGMQFTTRSTTDVSQASDDNDADPANPAPAVDSVKGQTGIFELGYNQTLTSVSAGYTGTAQVSITDSSVKEGNTGQTQLVFQVVLSGTQLAPVEIEYTTVDGNDVLHPDRNATWGSGDYEPVIDSQVLTFNPGETSKQIVILINADSTYENNEQFQLKILRAQRMDSTGAVNLPLSQPTILGTIINDDPIPTVSIQDYDPGAASPLFSATDFLNLSLFIAKLNTSAVPTLVSQFVWNQFSVADQQLLANVNSDTVDKERTLVAGLNSILLSTSIYTPARFAGVVLSAPTLALLGQPAGGSAPLLNRLLLQDAYPTDLVKTIAGDTEGAKARFFITLSNPSQYPVTIDWRTDAALTPQALPADGAATPSPLAGADFISAHGTAGDLANPPITFLPGVTTQVLLVTTVDDSLSEADEHFWVDLFNPVSATIADDRGYGVIPDNDPLPSIYIVPKTPFTDPNTFVTYPFMTEVNEGNNSANTVSFYVRLSAPSGQPVTFTWATSPGTAVESVFSGGTDAPDYVGFPNSTTPDNERELVFAPGQTQIEIKVKTVPDGRPEGTPDLDDSTQPNTETFFVNLLSATHANIATNHTTQSNHATVKIVDDDAVAADQGPWSVRFSDSDYEVQEPVSGTKTVDITLVRTPGSSEAVVVFFTNNGTATAGADYDGIFRQLVVFQDNELTKKISITIHSDNVVEGDETVLLSLRNPQGGPVRATPGTATLTIHDGNTPRLWIESPRLGAPQFLVSDFKDFDTLLNKLTTHSDAVSLYLWNRFSAPDQMHLTDPAYTAAQKQTVLLSELNLNILPGGLIHDPVRFAAVTLSRTTSNLLAQNPVGADLVLLNRWLLEDAYSVQLAKNAGINEGSGLVYTLKDFTVHLSAPAGPGGVDVQYQTVDLTARSDAGASSDFVFKTGTLHIPALGTSGTIQIQVYEDKDPELSETFAVRLYNPTGATLDPRDSAAIATIYDDDRKTLSFSVFYDTNGNGFRDLGEPSITTTSAKVTYSSGGAPLTVMASYDPIDDVYKASVLLGQVSLLVDGASIKFPYMSMTGPGATYKTSTDNESQSIKYQGIVGLPAFADVGYRINSIPAVDHPSTKDVGRGGTDDTLFGGPGNDTIDAGGGDDHVVGGHWMTATDDNAPINQGSYDAGVKARVNPADMLDPVYDNGPIFEVDVSSINAGGSISGEIWLDANNDGFEQPSELFAGQDVVVTLYTCAGNPVNALVTNTGHYTFSGLYLKPNPATSDYVVQFELPKGYVFLAPSADNKVTAGTRTSVVSVSGLTPAAVDIDAGIQVASLPPDGSFQFSAASYTVSQAVAGGVLTVTVARGSSFDSQAVLVRTQDGTAHAGVNYKSVSALLTFGVGETVKSVDIPIIDTGLPVSCTPPLTFNLVVRDVSGRPLAKAPVYITGPATISDDDTIQAGNDWDLVLGDSGRIDGTAVLHTDPLHPYNDPAGIFYSGGPGNDSIHGGNGPDFINGQLGNDKLSGDSGQDVVKADMGDDVVYVNLDDNYIDGGYGFDTVISTRDVPRIELNSSSLPTPTLIHKTAGGTPLSTFHLMSIEMAQLFGGPKDNVFDVTSWTGSAIIVGNGGKDVLLVQNNSDMLLNDATLAQSLLAHSLWGFYESASLSIAVSGATYHLAGLDQIHLTALGDNTIDASGYSMNLRLPGLPQLAVVDEGPRHVTLEGLGNDTLIGSKGDDTFVFHADSLPNVTQTIVGKAGRDTLDFSGTATGVTVDLSIVGASQTVLATRLSLILNDKLENITGSTASDTLTGNDVGNVFIGGMGDDILIGGSGPDTFLFDADGPLGTDTVTGKGGVDTLDFSGTSLAVTVNLATLAPTAQVVNGNLSLKLVDKIENATGGAGKDNLTGNDLKNTLRGGPNDDTLDGQSGDDTLDGGPGNNTLIGGIGTDTISEQGDTNFTLTNTTLTRGSGQVETLSSIENVNLTGGPNGNVFNLTDFTGTGIIDGGDDPNAPRADTLIVRADANFKLTNTSFELVGISFAPISLKGIDIAILTDGPGSHTLDAGGFSGTAVLSGGLGDDTLIGGTGLNIIDGGDGNDSYVQNLSGATKDVDFILQNNRLTIVQDPNAVLPDRPKTSIATLAGIEMASITGSPQDDSFDVSGWSLGNLTINGLGGSDSIVVQAPQVPSPTVSTVIVTNGAITFTGGLSITLNSIEEAVIMGSNGNDLLDASGFSGTVHLYGSEGDDTLTAGSGLNFLYGGPGNDVLTAGSGTSLLYGGSPISDQGTGNDRFVFLQYGVSHAALISGGDGEDTLDFSGFNLAVNVNLATFGVLQTVAPGELQLLLAGLDIEGIIGSAIGGNLTGNALANTFTLTGGTSTINGNGGAGVDVVSATADADFLLSGNPVNASLTIGGVPNTLLNIQLVKLTGGAHAHTVDASGYSGSTILQAGASGDTLRGGSGRDVLISGPGNDILRGGAGDDTYLFNVDQPQGSDTVDELFGLANGIDTLDFSPSHLVGVRVNLSLITTQNVTPSLITPNLRLTLTLGNSVENVIGTDQADQLTGNTLANTFTGGRGADTIDGGTGLNTIVETRDADFTLTNSSLTITGSSLLAEGDIRDPAAFIAKLQSDTNPNTLPVSQFLWSQFSSATQQLLTNGSIPVATRLTALVAALNQVLQGGAIYTPVRFAGVSLGSDTIELRDSIPAPSGQNLIRLNRWLLDDAYAMQIVTTHQRDTLTNIQIASLTGGAGDNKLNAALFDGNVTLNGGDGNDTLYAGTGTITLAGGAGNDTYVFDLSSVRNVFRPPATVTILELPNEGFADTLLGLGINGVALDLSKSTAQTFLDLHGNLLLTLYLPVVSGVGQVEFSF